MTTARIDRIKERFMNTKRCITAERLVLATEAYQKYAGDAIPVFRAHVFAHIVDNIGVKINDDELIVGMTSGTYRAGDLFPEYASTKGILADLDSFPERPYDPFEMTAGDREVIRDCLVDYWQGKSLEDLLDTVLPPSIREAVADDMISIGTRKCTPGATVPDYKKLCAAGLRGLIDECEQRMQDLTREEPRTGEKAASNAEAKELQERIDFLRGCIITGEALIRFAKRYGALARAMAAGETDEKRRAELERIAETCLWVPEYPPRSFAEALQLAWFVHIGLHIEARTTECHFGRFDQIFGPFLEADIAAGTLTEAEALELLEAFYLKTGEVIEVRDKWSSESFAGYPMWTIIMLGGVTREGKDGTNKLSYLALDAARELAMAEPVLALRTHKGTPEKLWEKAAEMIQLGLANPGFFNDDIAIPIVLSKGAAIEDALDWVIVGCTQPSPGGGSEGTPDAGYVSAAKALELALNNGVDPVTGKLSGIETGDARGFTKREELVEACITQMLHQYEMIRDGFKITQSHHMTRLPVMLASMTTGGCIESGKSLQDGGSTYKSAGLFITGPANLVDSIVAVDRVVFRDKIVTMDELLAALAKNFEGEERLRQLLLSQPKFGNDDPEVNELASSIMKRVAGTVQTWRDARGGRFDFTMMSQSVNVPQGKAVGATPDGRRAGEPVSDNSSPMMGRDIVGPTATVRSVASWNQLNFHDGALFNLRFDPRSVQGDKGRDIITGVIKTYFAEGGQHIQINVVDNKTLRAAQEKPEDYRSLVVRVAGYMAYFTELDRDVQESIIARTAHSA